MAPYISKIVTFRFARKFTEFFVDNPSWRQNILLHGIGREFHTTLAGGRISLHGVVTEFHSTLAGRRISLHGVGTEFHTTLAGGRI